MSPAETDPGFRTVLSNSLTPYELTTAARELLVSFPAAKVGREIVMGEMAWLFRP